MTATSTGNVKVGRRAAAQAVTFDHLRRLRRQDVVALRMLLRARPSDADLRVARESAGEILGVTPELRLETPRLVSRDLLDDPFVGIVFAHADGRHAVVQLDGRLAACAIDRVLGGEGGNAVPPFAAPPDPLTRGVLLYLAARACPPSSGWVVHRVATSAKDAREALGETTLARFGATAKLGSDEGLICLWLSAPPGGLQVEATRASSAVTDLEVPMVLDAAHGTLRTDALATLQPGDIVVLEHSGLTRASPIEGELVLRAAGARRTRWTITIEDDHSLRCTGEHHAPRMAPTAGRRHHEDDMDDAQDPIAKVGDAPIELSIEIARFTMPLEEIAALRTGEVVATGRRLGDQVALRAGERTLAVGELVDIDGEVGIRITSTS